MNPSMQIAKTLSEAVEWFEKLPDEFQDDAMAEKVAACLETWKREAQQVVATRSSRSKQSPATTNVRNDHDKEPSAENG